MSEYLNNPDVLYSIEDMYSPKKAKKEMLVIPADMLLELLPEKFLPLCTTAYAVLTSDEKNMIQAGLLEGLIRFITTFGYDDLSVCRVNQQFVNTFISIYSYITEIHFITYNILDISLTESQVYEYVFLLRQAVNDLLHNNNVGYKDLSAAEDPSEFNMCMKYYVYLDADISLITDNHKKQPYCNLFIKRVTCARN